MLRRRAKGKHTGPGGRRAAARRGDADADRTPADAGGPDAAAAKGPWDAADAPDDAVPRIDLGGLRVPTLDGVEVRVEADGRGDVSGVLLVHGASAVQLGAFAAPRTDGIWDEVREEIRVGIRAEGGTPEERDGEFGVELLARVVTADGAQPVRFVGVDGPRWFVRLVYTGAEATDPDPTSLLAESVRELVVVRGHEPLPVRDPLPLRLPREVVDGATGADPADGAAQSSDAAPKERPRMLAPRRGPEITEIR